MFRRKRGCPPLVASRRQGQLEAGAAACLLHQTQIAAEIPRQPDSEALAAMCMTWAQVCDATKTISRTGMLVKDAKGHPAANPLLKIREAALAQFLRYAVEFGFTPASRSRVQGQVQDQRKDNDPDLGKPRLKDFMVFPKVKS